MATARSTVRAQPQPFRAVVRRRERGHPGADGVEFRGRVAGGPGRGHGGRRVGVGGFHVADFGQCRGSLGQQPRPPRGRAVRIGQRPVAQSEQRHRDLAVPDAAHHQRRVGEQVKPPGWFGGVRGGDRVLQARGELAGPVFRRRQFDEQRRAVGLAGPGGLDGGQRGGQVAGGVLEGQRARRRRRRGCGPVGGLAQRGPVRGRPEQVRGDLTASFGGLAGQRFEGRGGAAVQRDQLVLAEAGVDAVADQGMAEPPGVRAIRPPGGQPGGLGCRQGRQHILARAADRGGQLGTELRAQHAGRGQQPASAVIQAARQ